jgi:hypothetical protein
MTGLIPILTMMRRFATSDYPAEYSSKCLTLASVWRAATSGWGIPQDSRHEMRDA